MTEPRIDYETAFAELNTLNHLFASHASYTLPRLNPAEFEVTANETNTVIVRGLRSGLYFGSARTRQGLQNGNYTYHYEPFFHVKPEKRTVTDWVKV
jgi:hypothetical protein